MIKIIPEKEKLQLQGVYVFKNLVTNKVYIGSTVMTFEKRFQHHMYHLRNNKHKNSHFQNSWNKYGEKNFSFDIIEICERDQCLIKEQYYLDTVLFAQEYIAKENDKFRELGYNINPSATGTPNLSEETIEKRSKTFKVFIDECSEWYAKFKNFEIDFEDIPEKYVPMCQAWHNNVPWNKGKTYESTDHLKVPKTITDEWRQVQKERGLRAREKSKRINVYDINKKFLMQFRSPQDVLEYSNSEENNLPLILNGKAKGKTLLAQNVAKACKTGKPYKGLYFDYELPDQ